MSKYRINIADKIYEMEVERLDEVAATIEKHQRTTSGREAAANSINVNESGIGQSVSERIVKKDNTVYSPMPGTIIKLYVKNGDAVKRGQVILVLEAMKMENEITSPKDGIISGLNVAERQSVPGNAVLFEVND